MKKKIIFRLFASVTLIFSQLQVFSSVIEIPAGEISTSTAWSTDTVKINGDITINSNATLTIGAKTTVLFQGSYMITIYGRVVAIGTVSDSIFFTREDTAGFYLDDISGSWKGFIFYADVLKPDTSIFKYCKFTMMKKSTANYTSLYINNFRVLFENSVFANMNQRAFLANYSIVTIRYCLFSGINGGSAAAFSASNGSSTLENNSIINTISGSHYSCLFFNGGENFVKNNFIYNSRFGPGAVSKYGTVNSNACKTHFINNIIINNEGSAIFTAESRDIIIGNVIANNAASNGGGGVYIYNCHPVILINNTIVNNSAAGSWGGGIYSSSQSETEVYNNIIYGNTAGADQQVYIAANNKSVLFINNDIEGGKAGITNNSLISTYHNNIDLDPQFASPSSGTGLQSDAADADWSLLTTSPCANIGLTTDQLPEPLTQYDARNKTRVKYAIPDLGAYEINVDKIEKYGTIGTETWMADTVVLLNYVYLPDNVVLTINPGTKVISQGHFAIYTDGGSIKAVGSPTDSIIFTIPDTTGYSTGDTLMGWRGIEFRGGGNSDSAIFKYCRISYAKTMGTGGSDNVPSVNGGGIFSYEYSNLVIDHCVFSNNVGNYGSAVYVRIGKAEITNSLFYNNVAGQSTLNLGINNCLLANNVIINNQGGGIYLHSSNGVTIVNSLIANNNYGSAIHLYGSHPIISYTNIINNDVYATYNAGIYLLYGSMPKIYNSIVWGQNYGQIASEDFNCKTEISNCILQDSISCFRGPGAVIKNNIKYSNPGFNAPTKIRGRTNEVFLADWKVNSLSPAIDAGTIDVPNMVSADYFGNSRIQKNAPDIGFYEHNGIVPSFIQNPKGKNICEGQSYNLFVEVADKAVFQWQKDGNNIPGATNDTLIIDLATVNDQGQYSCIATNRYGTITSNSALFNVKTGADILSTPENRFVPAASQTSINIPITGSLPLAYTWFKNNIVEPSYNSSTIKISSFDALHEGVYKLAVTNECGNDTSDSFTLSILPVTTMQGIDSLVCSGDTIVLRTIAGPTATLQWQKNGNDISGATGEYLTLNSVLVENAGNYNCKVTSSYGNTTTSPVYVTVSETPEIIVQPVSQWTSEGESFTSEVLAIGSKPLYYLWYKNDTAIAGEDDPRFILAGFQRKDEGRYRCVVNNNCGIVSSSEAYLYLAPYIIISNSNLSDNLCEGDTVTLDANSVAGATYQWYKDGAVISDETNSNIVFNGITSANSGNYFCAVSRSGLTKQTETRTITVQSPPEILVQLGSQWANEGNAYTVEVTASGSKPFTYQWYKDVSLIGSATSASYVITNFATVNEGKYLCEIQNTCGTATSADAYLYITPKITITNINHSTPCESDTVTLDANSGAGATYQWYKDGAVISGDTSSTITFNGIALRNAGNYFCTVTRSGLSKQTETRTIAVQTAPDIVLHPESQWAEIGSSYSINVSANGSKPLNYKWLKGSDPVISDNSGLHVFAGFMKSDEGIYVCIVSNTCGTDTSRKAAMYVSPQITINTTDGNPIVCKGDNISMSVATDISATYQWQKDGQNISGMNTSTLTISNATENSAGNYACKVNTLYKSTTTASVLLQVRTSPEITDQPEGTLITENDPFTLEVRADGSKPLKFQWQQDDIDIPGDTLFRLRMDTFRYENEGIYVCRISNVCGDIYSNAVAVNLAPKICMVTVTTDAADPVGHNTIVWEKLSKVNYTQYNIYRQTSTEGSYLYLGSVAGTAATQYDDLLVDPARMAYYYKITATDQNNMETDINLCKPHKNIHLMVTQQYGKPNVQLQWDEYIGFDYKTYYIYRSSNDIEGFGDTPYDSIASTNLAWTDVNVVPATGTSDPVYYYFVSAKKEVSCDSRVNTRKKAGGGLYSQSESNMEDNRLQSSNSINTLNSNLFELSCSPNPFNNSTEIRYRLPESADVTLEIVDLMGQQIVRLMNSKQPAGIQKYTLAGNMLNIKPGIYIVKLNSGGKIALTKLVKE